MAEPIRPASDVAPDARYSRVAQALHWAIAAAILVEIGLGWNMSGPRGPQTFATFQLHKSVGITILALTLARIAWRLAHRPPPLSPHLKAWEKGLAHAVHAGFYVLLLALPLTGWLAVSASPLGIPTLLYGTIPLPHLPVAASKGLSDGAGETHELLVKLALALILLHVAGALKHQFVDRGRDMARMLPAPAHRLGLATVAVVVAGVALMAFGRTVVLKPIPQPGAPAPVALAPVAPVPAEPVAPPAPEAPSPTAEAAPAAAPANEAATPAAPSRWRVNAARSSLGFATAWSQGPVDGRFTRWTADILFAPDALEKSRVSVSIDMASAVTGGGDTQSALPGDEWFAVARFPKAAFTATRFRSLGGDRYEARGALSLRGVDKPFTLPFTLKITGDTAVMTASASLDRTAFGVGTGEWARADDLPALVKLAIRVTATRTPN